MYIMRIQQSLLALALVLIGISLAACNLPASTEAPPLDQSVANTAAAETIIAQLTEVVETLTPVATESTLPETTQTPVISDITETVLPTTAPTAVLTEPAATATSPPPPTPTLDANDPKAGLGEPAFYDTFNNGDSWPLYTDKHVSFEVEDSHLVMTAFNPDNYNGWILTWPVISDFYLEMTTKTEQCSGKDQYGTMISCDGHYSLRRWNGQKYVQLVDWTPSEHINAGSNQTNRIGLMANGSLFSMYANNKLIGEFQDDTHGEGRFGVFIGSVNTPDLQVLVDEIAYWDLP
jgi:hypothetical protein